MKYRTLLFDADNTLLDFDANEAEAFRRMLEAMKVPYSEDLYRQYHQMNGDAWRQIERKELEVSEWLPIRFAVLMKQYGYEVDGEQWERVYRSYLNKGIQQMPYVHEVLKELQKRYRLYVITNGIEETQVFRMHGAGLEQYFREIFISARIGASKPSKEYFDYVKEHIPEFDSATTLVIGDSLTSDIRGGYEAGLDTCWITRDRKRKPKEVVPTYIIHSLLELFEVLEEPMPYNIEEM